MNYTVCVLAAGESSRFKGEKLLSIYGEKMLSEHILDLLNDLSHDDSIIINKVIITKPKLLDFFGTKLSKDWHLVVNQFYKEGLSTSIRLAVFEAIQNDSEFLLLFLADMPKINAFLTDKILRLMQIHPGKIIRPFYNFIPGFPVALPKSLFDELTRIKGDTGAKPVIERHKDMLIKYETNDMGSIFDIDEEN